MFLSTYINKLDKKGRASVPAAFRPLLMTEFFTGVILFRSLRLPALEGCSLEHLQQLNYRLAQQNLFSEAYNDLADCIFADAQMLTFDSEGRISLPQNLLEHANISQQLAFVGRGVTFQIWQPEAFHSHQNRARARLQDTPLALTLAAVKELT